MTSDAIPWDAEPSQPEHECSPACLETGCPFTLGRRDIPIESVGTCRSCGAVCLACLAEF